MIHRRSASLSSPPYSSPTTASSGRIAAIRSRTARSTAVSASVTGVRSGLVSTARSAAPKRASVISSARSASSRASARSSAGRLTFRMLAEDLERETTEVLQRLIRFNTVNPPGNERPAIEHLAGYLRDAGFAVELLAADENRPNLVADLAGDADGPTLCFLGHVDTVLADP